jgi:hypothetical protein
MQRLRRRPDRLLVLAQRARLFAEGDTGIVAELFNEHAAICERKAAAQTLNQKPKKPRPPKPEPPDSGRS